MQHEIICVFQHGELWEQYKILHSLNKAEIFSSTLFLKHQYLFYMKLKFIKKYKLLPGSGCARAGHLRLRITGTKR